MTAKGRKLKCRICILMTMVVVENVLVCYWTFCCRTRGAKLWCFDIKNNETVIYVNKLMHIKAKRHTDGKTTTTRQAGPSAGSRTKTQETHEGLIKITRRS
uniref:Uncharacterized protein n=1 Tax=Stegastes partitus TaxID=144197 RepID=A0A3B4ZZK7_9TELE